MSFNSAYVIKKADGRERKLLGYKRGKPPEDATRFSASRLGSGRLPGKVDLRPLMTQVENQGELNSCVANAVAGAYEYLAKRHLGSDGYEVSRLFVYYNARAASGMEAEDEGSMIGDAIASLREHGACSEETWAYREEAVNEEPTEDAYDEGANFLVESSEAVDIDLDAWRGALAEGNPIIFGCTLFDSFDSARRGKIPLPTKREKQRAEHGGHAMLCVGYSDPDRVFIVRNSWGEDWGDEGYCYMPYDYLMNPEYNDGDAWIIRQLDHFELDESTWSNDDESILTDLGGALNALSDEDYQALLDATGELALESRLAMILLAIAGADGEVSDDELRAIAEYAERVLLSLGVDADPEPLLKHALEKLNENAVVESIELFGQYLPADALAAIANEAMSIASADGMDSEEEGAIFDLVSAWQLGDGEEGDSEDEDEDEYGEEDPGYDDAEGDEEEGDEEDEDYDEDEED